MILSKILVILSFILFEQGTCAETVDLETFEAVSASIKNKQNAALQDEESLKVLPQYSQPQRKIQSTTEASESSLSTE